MKLKNAEDKESELIREVEHLQKSELELDEKIKAMEE